ncbi:cytochrome c oxidase subunit I [Chitinasiproducens palmae]|uniref:cytochrome-c oxidase n=1 Tax=Chitinasiproducens palmae TaxID=1770053 RepID=A0A1H2PIT6_9BURK|nr:cytochrome c oxidase subunit I [Chitinasiproducens palmae]SDV46166.1 cytochrome c oxidase subunit 1/cytochrome c oxidase subunit I+III [Chitinasiproducens palmae]
MASPESGSHSQGAVPDAQGDTPHRRVPRLGVVARGSAAEQRLRDTWETAPGWRGWLSTVDHKTIGLRYLVTAFLFLMVGGIEALIMRVQLARPDQTLLTPEQYNQLFTMHGVTMIFLYALPILSGFSNYLWPLVLGSRDMAFPRLNALSYWTFLFAGLLMYASFPLGEAANAGWFNYVPLANRAFNPGPNIDVYALGMVFLGASTTIGAANFVVTLFRMRAPGMSVNRLPVLVWGTLATSLANLVAVPAVSLAFFMLWLDRQFGTHFFDAVNGGRPLLWQHLFWMFGHPWVYAIVLPAMGIVSDALPTFCRRPLVGYAPVAISTMATMLMGFEVWIHHMFATGIATLALSFFGAASVVITVPSAVAVFAWLATIWTGRPVFRTPFLYFAAFIFLFVVGGVSGVMTAVVPLDWQLNETYFVVAHLHYVLLGINVFPVFGGLIYWFPKFTGRMMSERLGRWTFWIVFVGFNLGFFPMHVSGLLGMPRRIYTYSDGMGWNTANLLTSIGSFVFAIGVLLFVVNVLWSRRHGAVAGDNPWDAPTLEWSTPSPPPPYNFAVVPIVASMYPLWEDRLEDAKRRGLDEEAPTSARVPAADRVAQLRTASQADASPDGSADAREAAAADATLTRDAPVGEHDARRADNAAPNEEGRERGAAKEAHERSSLQRGFVLDQGREAFATTLLYARPEAILKMPGDSYAPLFLALAGLLLGIGLLLHAWWMAALAGLGGAIALIAWLWPERALGQTCAAPDAVRPAPEVPHG